MKRIIILCDGTGQSASRGELAVPTNVHRFGHAVLNDPKKSGAEQVVFYQSGVGTADLGWMGDIKQMDGTGDWALNCNDQPSVDSAMSRVIQRNIVGDAYSARSASICIAVHSCT